MKSPRNRLGAPALVFAVATIAWGATPGCGAAPTEESELPDGDVAISAGGDGPVDQAEQPVVETCVTVSRGLFGSVTDTQIAGDASKIGKNYGAGLAMITGFVGPGQRKTLVRFDVSMVPAGATVNSATLTLTAREANFSTVNAHLAQVPWNEGTATWSSFYGTPPPQFVSAPLASAPAVVGPMDFDVASAVSAWVTSGVANNGLFLEQSGFYYTNFYTSDDPIVAVRPQLEICYQATCIDGVQNGTETDVDCGGSSCGPCATGDACVTGTDCQSTRCTGFTCTDLLLVSELQTRGTNGGNDEFIELYNPTDYPVVLDNTWTIEARSAVGTCTSNSYAVRVTGAGQIIPAKKHLLFTNNNGSGPYDGAIAGNATYANGITDASSVVLKKNGAVVDALCFFYDATTQNNLTGCATPYTCEGAPISNLPHNNGTSVASNADVSLERKPGGVAGNGTDTDVNASDFQSAVASNPEGLPASCVDGVKNGTETDVDCGGGCVACANNKTCSVDADCESVKCAAGVCTARLLLSELQTRGSNGGNDELIEVYNPSSVSVTFDATWTIAARSAVGTCASNASVVRVTGTGQVIPAHGHLLFVNNAAPAYNGPTAGNATYGTGIQDASNVVLAKGAVTIDALCFYFDAATQNNLLTCSTPYVCEGAPVSNLPHNNTTVGASNSDVSLDRKPGGGGGNAIDTNVNASDFSSGVASNPQNLASPPAP